MDTGTVLFALFDFCVLLVSFLSLCIVCDEHLVPAVEVFIVQFEVPEEVAAVTLVAFGSAAPELFLNSVSAVAQTSDLSLAAILGSGIIAFGLIPPLCILSASQSKIKLHLYPILRESCFYLIGLFIFLGAIHDGKIASHEAGTLIFVYLCYTGIVACMYFRNKAATEAAAQADSAQGGVLSELVSLTSNNDVIEITIQSGGRGGSPVNTTEEAAMLSPTALSPGRESACHFFPTLSRSNSDLTRQRRSGRNGGGEGINTVQRSSSRTNIESTLSDERRGTEMSAGVNTADSELASLIGDDVESVSAGIGISQTGTNDDNTESATQSTVHSTAMRGFYCIYSPIEHAIRSLLPALHPQIPHFIAGNTAVMNSNRNPVISSTKVPLRRAVLVLASSIAAIGVLAVSIVVFCESVIGKLGFSSTAVGATIVALGAEIPDTVSAVALARNGYYNAAMAGAIGSQVINVSLGVGVPALLVCVFGDGFLHISGPQTASLVLLTCLLIIVILSYVTVTVPVGKMLLRRQWADHTIVSKAGAAFQIVVWGLTYVTFLHLNANNDPATAAEPSAGAESAGV